MVRTYLNDHGDEVAKKIELQAAALIGTLEMYLKGDRPSKLLDKLSFGSFNKTFAPTKTAFTHAGNVRRVRPSGSNGCGR
ncbi:MAG: hypothetical protein KGZ92_10980 [Firmicutes bacterium]|nr:hypothetical protein [Bacillota bacterium]MBS4054420.1 hypothetical protein [Thermaerobacter sp.]